MLAHLVRLLSVVAIAYLAWAALLWSRQAQLMYPIASREPRALRGPLPDGAEALELEPAEGADPVRAVWLPARNAAARAPAIVYLHGNAELVESIAAAFGPLRAEGVHVLLVEYPGYGGAAGTPSFDSLVRAAVAGFDWVAARDDVDAAHIVAMGISIGGGPAAELTARRPVRALVLLSTFASTGAFARGFGLPAFLVRDRFDNLARVAAFAGPLLIMHGRRDEVIGFAHGQALAHAAPHARFVALECGHNDCYYLGAQFARDVGAFLRESAVLDPPPAHAD